MNIIEQLRILGFDPESEKEIEIVDIKKKYRELVLKYHPDKLGEGEEDCNEFIRITDAYKSIMDYYTENDNSISSLLRDLNYDNAYDNDSLGGSESDREDLREDEDHDKLLKTTINIVNYIYDLCQIYKTAKEKAQIKTEELSQKCQNCGYKDLNIVLRMELPEYYHKCEDNLVTKIIVNVKDIKGNKQIRVLYIKHSIPKIEHLFPDCGDYCKICEKYGNIIVRVVINNYKPIDNGNYIISLDKNMKDLHCVYEITLYELLFGLYKRCLLFTGKEQWFEINMPHFLDVIGKKIVSNCEDVGIKYCEYDGAPFSRGNFVMHYKLSEVIDISKYQNNSLFKKFAEIALQ